MNKSNFNPDLGILILRMGIGLMFIYHGAPKVFDGPEKWIKIGSAMKFLGITFWPEMWGLFAGLAEMGGGICLVLGTLIRPACTLMAFTMLVATLKHLGEGDSFLKASHAIEDGIVFLSLLWIGPGRYTLKRFLARQSGIPLER